jgi:2-methylcitrate dehydratase PrpD
MSAWPFFTGGHDAGGNRMTIAIELAKRVRAITYQSLPQAAVESAKIGILDTVGVTLAGSLEPCVRIARRVSAAPGPALLFGSTQRLSVTDATLLNGVAAHALDFDDCNNTLGGHPSAPILPGLFALADTMPVSGRDFIAAYVAGFETETRIARAVNFHHYDKGWHPTATLGVFGAAAAGSRLLALSEEQTATALAMAASLSSGLKANFGTMTKPLHVGSCAQNGVMVALLAREGMTASHDVFEHPQGFFNVFNGRGNFDADAALAGWADPLDIISPGIVIKQYPCCASTHAGIDAMLDLVRAHDLTPANVARVVAWLHPRRLAHVDRPTPRSALDAKFSLQYCLARALVDRKVVLSQFENDVHLDPRVVAMLARIEAAPHPQLPDHDPRFGAEVSVTTTDGRQLRKAVDAAAGRLPDDPIPELQLRAKYRDCAARALTAAGVDRSLDLLAGLETLGQVSALAETLSAECRFAQPGGRTALARAV